MTGDSVSVSGSAPIITGKPAAATAGAELTNDKSPLIPCITATPSTTSAF